MIEKWEKYKIDLLLNEKDLLIKYKKINKKLKKSRNNHENVRIDDSDGSRDDRTNIETLNAIKIIDVLKDKRSNNVIVVTNDYSDHNKWFKELSSCAVLSFDCEGVDLSRYGKISIIQLATTEKCYLFDVLCFNNKEYDMNPTHDIGNDKPVSKMVELLKLILENENIIKIIHDCKMDADSCYHHLNIAIQGMIL